MGQGLDPSELLAENEGASEELKAKAKEEEKASSPAGFQTFKKNYDDQTLAGKDKILTMKKELKDAVALAFAREANKDDGAKRQILEISGR